jgi:hypothetical protein
MGQQSPRQVRATQEGASARKRAEAPRVSHLKLGRA